MSEQFCDIGGGITLCYEDFGDPADPTLLLVMGLSMQMIAWHEDFCEELAGRGFHVVRFDNRDMGRSTRMSFRPSTPGQLLRRRTGPEQYTLSDLAGDAAKLLAKLDLAPAHVVGASMGGMIAQTIAAEHPESVRSLTSIMSNTGNRWRGQPSPRMWKYMLKAPPRHPEEFMQRAKDVFGVIGSTGFEHAPGHLEELTSRSVERGIDVAATGRQLGAVIASGDRTRALHEISAPTLVIHGTVDHMVSPSGGRATARAIPGARLVMIDGMGHDLPRGVWPRLIDEISEHAKAADAANPDTEEIEHARTAGA
jgi:pimeloyl-ACP methyl ester carboxylesterase